MTVEGLINQITEYAQWLYYRQWQWWELLTAGIIALVLLLLVGNTRRKARANIRRLKQRSPIIGVKLAHRH